MTWDEKTKVCRLDSPHALSKDSKPIPVPIDVLTVTRVQVCGKAIPASAPHCIGCTGYFCAAHQAPGHDCKAVKRRMQKLRDAVSGPGEQGALGGTTLRME